LEPIPQSLGAKGVTDDYVRGSSLLVVGRLVAQLADIGVLVILARYLSKSDYGALAYALSLIVLFKALALFELPNTLGRFLPIYREAGREDSVLGSVLAGVLLVAALGLALAIGIDIGIVGLHVHPTGDSTALRMAALLAFVIPIEALDVLLTSLFAVFAGARAIFVRQAILGPTLRIAFIVSVLALHADVRGVGIGYLCAGAAGVLTYGVMLHSLLRRQFGGARRLRIRMSFPVRELVFFAAPLLASTLVWTLMESSDSLLLGHFRSTEEVATFRAVMPLAVLNKGVILTFGLLYTPMIARLYARRRSTEISDAYWRSAAWVTLLTLPVFVLTFSFAHATTIGLLGEKYSGSVKIMAILAFGYFFHTALGYNGLTLRIYGKLRYSVVVDLFAAVMNVGVNILLIPPFGALGAAVGTTSTLVVHNVLKQWGLRRYTGISLFNLRYANIYALTFGIAVALLLVQLLVPSTLWLAVVIAVGAGLAVLRWGGATLDVRAVFPELARVPLLASLLAPVRA
jgi:O-antigen/teichoic acid export membrane protein